MPTRTIELTDRDESFIAAGIKAGRYSDASEIVTEALHLLEEREQDEQTKLNWLRNAAQEAIDSLDRGEGKSFASMDELVDYLSRRDRPAASAVNNNVRIA